MIIDLKTRIFLGSVVRSAQVRQHVETMLVPQKSADLSYRFARNSDGNFTMPFNDITNPGVIPGFKLFHESVELFGHKTLFYITETPEPQMIKNKLCVSASLQFRSKLRRPSAFVSGRN